MRRLATKVAERPFDDHEEVWPGPWAAHFNLHQLVIVLFEKRLDEIVV